MDFFRRVRKTAVADRAGRVGDQVDDVLRAVHVAGSELVVGLLAEHRLLEVDVRARVVLPADADDLVRVAAGDLDFQRAPGVESAALTVDLLELGDGNLVDGAGFV